MPQFFMSIVLLFGIFQAGWQAWLYDNTTGQLTQVTSEGTVVDAFTLPADVYPQNVAVSHNGQWFAYMAYSDTPRFRVYHRPTNTITVDFAPAQGAIVTDSLSFVASSAIYSVDDTSVAFGYSDGGGNWQVLRFETGTGSIQATLDGSQLEQVAQFDARGRSPIVQRMDEAGQVVFVLAQPFSGYQVNFETAYVWDGATTVVPTGQPTAVDADVRADRVITTLFDPNRSNSESEFAYPQANALILANPQGQGVLFNTANLSMFWPRFVAGGTAILVGGYSAENRASWLILDLNGQLVGDFPPVQMTGVGGTPNGFAYTVNASAEGGALLYDVSVALTASAPREVWASDPTSRTRLIWVGSQSS